MDRSGPSATEIHSPGSGEVNVLCGGGYHAACSLCPDGRGSTMAAQTHLVVINVSNPVLWDTVTTVSVRESLRVSSQWLSAVMVKRLHSFSDEAKRKESQRPPRPVPANKHFPR